MTLGLTILGLLAKYLPLAIAAFQAGIAEFDSIQTTGAQIHASAANPTEADRATAEAEITKLEALLNNGVSSG